jgi:2-keto-3-deoxy-L-rhamnonate aldolase RhmA
MVESFFRQALLQRRVIVGTWLEINHPTVAEVLAKAGCEWIGIDVEHTDIDITSLTALLRGMYGRGAAPVVRVATNKVLAIRRALDAGAAGVLVPFVNTAEQAKRAVAAAKYPPVGVRGFSFCRANNWGADFEAEAQSANDETAVIVMIETKEGVENIQEILAVDGVDAVFIGPYDLSGSYGIPGQIQAPVVKQACQRVVNACSRAGKSVGLLMVKPTLKSVQQAIDDGYTLLCLGVDVVFLSDRVQATRALALEALEKTSHYT